MNSLEIAISGSKLHPSTLSINMSTGNVEQSLAFFKVFDLAFFAPGSVIIVHLAALFHQKLSFLEAPLSTAGGILAVISGIAMIYVVGAANFSLTWAAFSKFRGSSLCKSLYSLFPERSDNLPPIAQRFQENTRDELLLYFWYLRGTFMALSCSLVISAFMTIIGKILSKSGVVSSSL